MYTPIAKRKRKEITRPHCFTVRLDDSQLQLLRDTSKTTGLSEADVIRATLEGITIKPRNDKLTQSVLKELCMWGNNLNQIARLSNELAKVGQVMPNSLMETLEIIKNRLDTIKAKL